MSQTSYAVDVTDLGPEGSLRNTLPAAIVGGKIAKTDIKFGRLCVYKTASGAPFADLPTATGEITGGTALGVSMWDPVKMQTSIPGSTSGLYAAGEPLPLVKRGRVTVRTEDSCVEGASVFVRFTSDGGSNTDLGTFRSDADSGKAVALPGAVWRTTRNTAGAAEIDINLP
jgi:hypothetical protein